VEAYKLAEEVAKAEWDAAKAANERSPGAFSVFELRRLELTYQRSGIQKEVEAYSLEVATLDAQAAYAQYKQARDMVQRYELRAPHTGRVERVEKYKGAWVSPGTPVVQLTRMDRLRVEGRVSQKRFHPGDVDGRRADVQVFLAGGEDDRSVTVSDVEIVASYIIEEDGSFRILAEFDNQKQGSKWLLNPGLSAKIVLR
jgi:multidrug resistance efflux pump